MRRLTCTGTHGTQMHLHICIRVRLQVSAGAADDGCEHRLNVSGRNVCDGLAANHGGFHWYHLCVGKWRGLVKLGVSVSVVGPMDGTFVAGGVVFAEADGEDGSREKVSLVHTDNNRLH